ncbi:MAG: acyl-ACP--UDP-N-acetylglucosamine O-acyltransferase [Candidatus Omnitrophica bacterium]|nr:acyl-ACP--UDP-N-acetylglucosamine O-acyltransferase [Candidatus Omnitrophota bacterium]MBD3268910.1 acyl-ACP--UDP-N-acetylglucosamine O-acyltransferase [Candidatus Omnitrophota bacterium]
MIHDSAVIEKGAFLDEGVDIGPYSVIGKSVKLKKGVRIGSYVHIKGNTVVGENTYISTGAVLGELPQMLGMKDSAGKLYIGKNNTIREYVTIHTSTSPDKATCIGDDCFLMAFSHIAHDCKLGEGVVVCNGSLVAGFVEIGEKTFVSGNAVIQQFSRIGRLVMIAGLARVNRDVPPFMLVMGDSKVWGINIVGLKRAGFTKEDRAGIKKAYTCMYRKGESLKSSLDKIEAINSDKVREIKVFIMASKKGICGGKNNTLREKIFLDYPCLFRTKIQSYSLFSKYKSRFSG